MTLCLFTFILPRDVVRAETPYACDFDLKLDVLESGTVSVTQKMNLANLGVKELLTDMKIKLPFQASNIVIKNGFADSPQTISYQYSEQDNVIDVDFGKYFISGNSTATYTLLYSVNDLLKVDNSGAKSLSLPRFNFCASSHNKLSLSYPESWGAPQYSDLTGPENPSLVIWQAGQHYSFMIDWVWGVGRTVPLPSSTFNEVMIEETQMGINVSQDNYHNELIDYSDKAPTEGYIKGSLSKRSLPQNLPLIQPEFYTNNFSLRQYIPLVSLSRLERYHELITRNVPLEFVNSSPLADNDNDSLGYAITWAKALESEGASPYVVFGPVNIPKSDKVYWGYWVGAMLDGVWVEYDPYFEDVFGYSGFEQVTPQRQTWGIVTRESLYVVQGLNNISNRDTILQGNLAESKVLGDKIDVNATLKIQNAINREVILTITNNSNHIVYLNDIEIAGKSLIDEGNRGQGVLPLQSKVIDLSKAIDAREIAKDSKLLEGKVLGLTNGNNLSLPVNVSVIDESWVYPIYFVLLLCFYLLVLLILKNLKHEIKLYWQKIHVKHEPEQDSEVDDELLLAELPHKSLGSYHHSRHL